MGSLLNSRANMAAADDLARVVATERPLALVGAGMSVAAGMPDWRGLLAELEKELPPLAEDYLEALRRESDILWRAEEYRRLIGADDFHKYLKKRFSGAITLRDDAPVIAFVKLPFRHILTTNYDDVLLHAHDKAGFSRPRVLNWSREDEVRSFIFGLRAEAPIRFLLHLHGRFEDPQSIIITDNDYTERYVRSADTARKLFAIFTTERVVFAGFSLDDPDLMALMREVNAIMRPEEARHFAIMSLERPITEMFERNRLRKRYGVEPVFYDNRDGTHAGLAEVLARITPIAKPVLASPDAKKSSKVTPTRPLPEFDPEDPQKGLWGGRSVVNGRELTAVVREIESDWFEAKIIVRSTNPRKPLTGTVIFHLHPTLPGSTRTVRVRNGQASVRVESYGAYTVGAELDGGKTLLELDLATIEDAPAMFRLN
jgi:hypothetical protein